MYNKRTNKDQKSPVTQFPRLMSPHIPPVKIGFYDPFEVYPKIRDTASTKLQLTNLHWRKTATESLRSIPKLPTILVEETPKIFDNNPSSSHYKVNETFNPLQTILNLLSTPYARVMFFQCDNTDTYKSQVRPLIQVWKEQNIENANCPIDWTIVYYINTDAETKHHQRVFDKLKTDFTGTDNADRFIKLKSHYVNALEETETWNSFGTKLKDSILFSFSSKLQVLRDAIFSENSSEPLTSIVLKEGIARQFLTLRLFEDSLGEYDHLEQLINQYATDFKLDDDSLISLDHFIASNELITSIEQKPTRFDLKSYVFAKQYIVLEALADSAPSVSIASLHVSEFLKRLEAYIIDISHLFEESTKVNEWVYKTIHEVLILDMCIKIIEAEQDDETVNQIFERFGELLLLQRSKLLSIGSIFGYHINGILTDITLSTGNTLTYDILKPVLESSEAFEDQYCSLTETAIKHFSVSGRPRAVDALSIDIALLDYQNKQYGKAALVLANCPEFYRTEGWDYIGFHLLEAYIDCLENIKNISEFFDQSKEYLLASNYILLLSSTKSKQFVSQEKLKETAQKLAEINIAEPVTFPLDGIFDIDVSPFVTPSKNSLEIEVSLSHSLPLDLKLSEITLVLINEENQPLSFSTTNHTVSSSGIFKLQHNDMIFGNFKLSKCTIDIGPVKLVHEFYKNTEITVFPSANSTSLSIGASKRMNLSSKTVSIFIDTKDELDSVEVIITPLDDLEIQGEDLTVFQDKNSLEFERTELNLKFQHLDNDKSIEIVVPYIPNPKSSLLNLLVEMIYSINGVRYSQSIKKTMDNSLSIAVSVQDIYKNNGLYSNFTIGTADINLPIRIINVDLKENEKYKVQSAVKPSELIAFGEQPGNFFFKIDKKNDTSQDLDSLVLDIEFREVAEELYKIWKELVQKSLKDEDLEIFTALFCDIQKLEFNYQKYAINSCLEITNADKFNWNLLNAVPIDKREKVFKIIKNLLDGSNTFAPIEFSNKHLFIDVSIPLVKVIHTVELKFPKEMIYTILGEEISIDLNVKSLLNSGSTNEEPSEKRKVSFKGDDSNIYDLEILTNQDTWLINGKTKFSFELEPNNDQANTFSNKLTLIPLKVGKITLPKIKITNESFRNKSEYLMEIDYKNENETIYVVSERSR